MVEEGKGWRESAKEEDLQLGGFIHRVSGHHSEKDWGLFCGSRCARYLVRGKEYQMYQDGESQSHSQSYRHTSLRKDPRSRLLREMQLGCFLLARATWRSIGFTANFQ